MPLFFYRPRNCTLSIESVSAHSATPFISVVSLFFAGWQNIIDGNGKVQGQLFIKVVYKPYVESTKPDQSQDYECRDCYFPLRCVQKINIFWWNNRNTCFFLSRSGNRVTLYSCARNLDEDIAIPLIAELGQVRELLICQKKVITVLIVKYAHKYFAWRQRNAKQIPLKFSDRHQKRGFYVASGALQVTLRWLTTAKSAKFIRKFGDGLKLFRSSFPNTHFAFFLHQN